MRTQTISQILTDKGDNKTWHPVARAITGCPKNYLRLGCPKNS